MARENLQVVLRDELSAAFAAFMEREKGRFDSRSAAGAYLLERGIEAELSGRAESPILAKVKAELRDVVRTETGVATAELLRALGYDPGRPDETVIGAAKRQGSRGAALAVHGGKHAMAATIALRWALLYLTDNDEALVATYMREATAAADDFYRSLSTRGERPPRPDSPGGESAERRSA